MRLLIAVAVVGALAAACALPGGSRSEPTPAELPASSGESRWETIDEDRVRVWPSSGSVQEGVAYRMTVYTHCGLDHQLDFDGSFWEVTATPDDPGQMLDDPDDEGVIRLVSQDEAVYRSSAGVEFHLGRTDGPREIFLCE